MAAMTSRQRVLAAINHELPDRVPIQMQGITCPRLYADGLALRHAADLSEFGSGEGVFEDEKALRAFVEFRTALGADVAWVAPSYRGPAPPEGKTHWLTILQGPSSAGYSQSRDAIPLAGASTVADVEKFPWPSPDDFDCSGLRAEAEALGDQARELVLGWEPFFNRILDLFGMEEGMVKLHAQPELIEAALERIEDYVLTKTEKALREVSGVCDTFWWGDDFADSRGVMIGPENWRRFFAPSFRRLIDLVHRYGLKFRLHCCGTFVDVLPDLVDMGLDLWEPCQVHLPANDPAFLKREFGRHITFCGGVNNQRTLPFGTAEEVRREVRERIDVLGCGGGYLCGPAHDVSPDVSKENLFALLDEIKNYRNPECML